MPDTTDEIWVEDLVRRSRAVIPRVDVDVDAAVARAGKQRRLRRALHAGSMTAGLAVAVLAVPLVSDGLRGNDPPPARAVAIAQPVGTAEISQTGPDCLVDEVLEGVPLLGGQTTTEMGLDHLVGGPTPPPAVKQGTVPRGFEPTSLVICRLQLPVSSDVDPRTVEEVWFEGDLERVTAALAVPSEPLGGGCYLALETPPQVYLVDAEGRAVRPTLPTDRCNYVYREVYAAMDALTQVDVIEHRGQYDQVDRAVLDAAAERLRAAMDEQGIAYYDITPTAPLDGLLVHVVDTSPETEEFALTLIRDTARDIRVVLRRG